MTNFGKRSQISPIFAVSPLPTSICLVQIQASRKAHTPMKMSMNTFRVAAVPRIQPGWYLIPCAAALARMSASVMPPLATAAPSVLTESAIHAPAAIGCWSRK